MSDGLVFIGKKLGLLGLPGIPGRDLKAHEVDLFGGETFLLETGLYEKPPTKRKRRQSSDVVDDEIEEVED